MFAEQPKELDPQATLQLFQSAIQCNFCELIQAPKLLRDDILHLPQPGFIGSEYATKRVLLIGQNPGTPVVITPDEQRYADARRAFKEAPTTDSMRELSSVIARYMPTWLIHTKHIADLLAASGLKPSEIAFFNAIRCRTQKGPSMEPSSSMVRACMDRHFSAWIDHLAPRVVVCIGKWAYDRVQPSLASRSIPVEFLDRVRSMSNERREADTRRVAAYVRQHIG